MQKKSHYFALDGLRGLAAISVLLYHLGHWQGQPWLATNASLAVDFFFALSGYVLCIAYSEKLGSGMSVAVFIKIRLIRLMPLIVVATLMSATYLVARVLLLGDKQINLEEVGMASLFGMLLIPIFSATKSIGGPQVFPLNGPQYTLFLEVAVNVFWAATKRWETLWTTIGLAVVGYSLIWIYGAGGDEVGTFWTGIPRVLGSYYAGAAVAHAQQRWPQLRDPRHAKWFWPLLLGTAVLFYWPSNLPPAIDWMWSVLISPLILITGSAVRLEGHIQRVARGLGELSYPLYALHYPVFVWVNGAYQQVLGKKDFAVGTALTVPAAIAGAWILLKWFDEPVRKLLTPSHSGKSRRSANA
jgi:peptidoglycan/LPS O-acetylase OafA/YrhL